MLEEGNDRQALTNAHAEYFRGIEMANPYLFRYQPLLETDTYIGEASEYFLKLSVYIRSLTNKLEDMRLSPPEPSLLRQHGRTRALIENNMRIAIGFYFNGLAEAFPRWVGEPIFTLRNKDSVVVTFDSKKRLDQIGAGILISQNNEAFYTELALSPVSTG